MQLAAGLVFSAVAAAVPAAALVGPPAEGSRYALIVQGASGDPTYATLHRGWLDRLAAALRTRLKFEATRLTVLAEQAGPGVERSTAENVRATLARYAKEMKADDLLFVMLIGHGGGDGADAKFNLVGPDLTLPEWNAVLKPIQGRIAVVDATGSSFPYLAGLAAPGRVVITATSGFAQRYHTVFADAFVQAIEAPAADADKNGRISLLEAFTHASRLVAQHYEQDGRLSTETAMLDDTGDGIGRNAVSPGPDGVIAGLTYLDAAAIPTAADPEVQALLVRRQALTEQIDDLRRRRPGMPDAEFDQEFEKLIIELAVVSRDVRRRGGG